MSRLRTRRLNLVLVWLLLLALLPAQLPATPAAQAAPAHQSAASSRYQKVGVVNATAPITALSDGRCDVLRIDPRDEDGNLPSPPAINTLRDLNAYVLWDAYFWRNGDGAVVKIYRNTAVAPNGTNEYVVNIAGSVPAGLTPDLHDLYANLGSQSELYMNVVSPYSELVRQALLDAAEGSEPVFQGSQKKVILTGHSQGGNVAQNTAVGVIFADLPELAGSRYGQLAQVFSNNQITIAGGVFAGSRPSYLLDYFNRTKRTQANIGQAKPYDSFLFQAENNDIVPLLGTPDTIYNSGTTIGSDLTTTSMALVEAEILRRTVPILTPLPLLDPQVRNFLHLLDVSTYSIVDVGLEVAGWPNLPTLPQNKRQFVLQRAQVSFDDQRQPQEQEKRDQGYYAHGSSYGDPTIGGGGEVSPHSFFPLYDGNDGLTNVFPSQVPARWIVPDALSTNGGPLQLEYVAGYGFDCRSPVKIEKVQGECASVNAEIKDKGATPDGVPDTAWVDTTTIQKDGKELDPDRSVKESRISKWANQDGSVTKESIYWNNATATLNRNVHSIKCHTWDAYETIPAQYYVGQHTVKTDIEVGNKVEGFADGSWVGYGFVHFDKPTQSIEIMAQVPERAGNPMITVHLNSPDNAQVGSIQLEPSYVNVPVDQYGNTMPTSAPIVFKGGVSNITGIHYVYLKVRQFPRPATFEDRINDLLTLHWLRFSPEPPPPPKPPRPDSVQPMQYPPQNPAQPSRASRQNDGKVFSRVIGRGGSPLRASPRRDAPPRPALKPQPVANGHGDPHINTIDGVAYTSLALGEFIYVRDTLAVTNGLEVQARQERLPGFPDWASFITAAAVRAGDTTFEVRLPEQGSRVLPLLINGQPVFLAPGDYRFGSSTVTIAPDNTISVRMPTTPDGEAIARIGTRSETLAGATNEPVVALDVAFSSPANGGRYRGIFGTSDGQQYNELVDRDGTLLMTIDQVAEAWRITDASESLFRYAAGQGPATFNKVQTATFPDAAYLNGANPQGRNYIEAAQALLASACQSDPSLVDPVFITELALELATGRSADNIVAAGLCNAPQVAGASQSEDNALIGLDFNGSVTLHDHPTIGVADVRVQISAPELGDALLCDATTFEGGRYECSLADTPAFFGGRSSLSLRYTLSGRGPTVVATDTISLPAPGAFAALSKHMSASPATVLILTGQIATPDGTPLAGAALRISGPALAETSANDQGIYQVALPLPDGLRATDLTYEGGDLENDTYVRLTRPLMLNSTGLVTITQHLRLQNTPIPQGDPAGQAARERLLLVSGLVRNTADNGRGVAGVEITVSSPALQGGLCRTATGSDGSYTCPARLTGDQGLSATVTARGLGSSEVYSRQISVAAAALPALGSSTLVSVPEISGAFQARVLTIQLGLVNALAPGEAVLANEVLVTSPQLGRLCTYHAPVGFASFTCQTQAVAAQPFDLEYTISGPWGSSTASSSVTSIPASGPINTSATASISPITLALTGRVLDGSTALSGAEVTLRSPLFARDYRSTTDAQGRYSLNPYLANELARGGTISATATLNSASAVVTATLTDLVAGRSNPATLPDIQLNHRSVLFQGSLINSFTNATLNAGPTTVMIRRASDGTLLCQTSASQTYNCQASITDAAPFDVHYTASGAWGSATASGTVPQIGVGVNGSYPRTISVSPTMVQFDGVVKTSSGQAVGYATLRLSGADLLDTPSIQTTYDGRFSIKAVVRPGVASGAVRFQISNSNGYYTIDGSFANVTQANQVNLQPQQTLTLAATTRPLYLRGKITNSHAPAMDLRGKVSVKVRLGSEERVVGLDGYYGTNTYATGFTIGTTQPFSVTYTVLGEWGSTVFTTTVNPASVTNDIVWQDATISPTTLRVSGRLSGAKGPHANTDLFLSINQRAFSSNQYVRTNAQGDYSLDMLVPAGVISGTLYVRTTVNNATVEREQALRDLLAGQLNPRTFDLDVNVVRVNGTIFNGNAPITLYNGTPGFQQLEGNDTSVRVSVGGQQICQATASYYGYDCAFGSAEQGSFEVTLTASGPWGSAVFTRTIPPALARPTLITNDLTVYPTTLRLHGHLTGVDNSPLTNGNLSVSGSSNPDVYGSSSAYTDANGRYETYVVLNQGVTSGTLNIWIDPYYPGEGNSEFTTSIARSFSSATPNSLTEVINDVSFTERSLSIGLELTNAFTNQSLSFDTAEIRRKDTGALVCTLTPSSCRIRLTTNADFTVLVNIQADWGSAQIEGVVRPSTKTSIWDTFFINAAVRPTTLQVVGTVTRAGQPVNNLSVSISGASLVSSGYGSTNASGQYSIFVVPRADAPSGPLQVYLSYPFYQTFNGSYSVPAGQSGTVVPVSGPAINLP